MDKIIDAPIHWVLFTALGLSPESAPGQILELFLHSSVKVILLLLVMISVIGVLRTYATKEMMNKYLGNNNKLIATFCAAVFAILTPFCSCSSIPIFLAMLRMGIPFSALISFLAVSPLVNEYLMVIMPSYFGFGITAVYIFGGMGIGMLGGYILEKTGMEKYIEPGMSGSTDSLPVFNKFKDRLKFGVNEGVDIVKKLWIWILIGVGIGALTSVYMSDDTALKIANFGGVFSVPLAAAVGAPIYASCASIVPIAVLLFSKPIPLGTALAFLMTASAMSIPEAILLRKAMKLKLLGAFFLMVFIGIIILGYLINFLSPYLI